jgi:hypothetical protein
MRALVSSMLAIGVVAGMLAGSSRIETVPLIVIPQGISAHTFGGETVFINRQGSLQLTGFLGRDPESSQPLKWCPVSAVFLEPSGGTIWDPQGRYVAGASKRDLTTVPVTADERTQEVGAAPSAAKPAGGASDGTISGESKLVYDNWVGGRLKLYDEFCSNPVG